MTPEEIRFVAEQEDFIREHLREDPARLALKYGKDPSKKLLIAQIASRQKIEKKIPSWYRNLQLVLPPVPNLEQASSEATATLKASLLEGKKLLDLTGGTGIDTCFLSKNFSDTVYVERNEDLASLARHNFKILETSIEVIAGDGIRILKDSDADVVYVDPHRRDSHGKKIFFLEDSEPDLLPDLPWLIAGNRLTLIKTSPLLDIQMGIAQLQYVTEIWVISVKNECKEVIYLVRAHSPEGNPKVRTFNITENTLEEFTFEWQERNLQKPALSDPLKYLYEPNVSILKSQAQDLVSNRSGLKKLHPNSHLYTSQKLIPGYPGKVFEVIEITRPYDKKLRNQRFNVISRNFPDKAHLIEKKLRLKPSKDEFLLATTLENNKKAFLQCHLLTDKS